MNRLAALAAPLALTLLAIACGTPPPECAPPERPYRTCANGNVFECPMGTPAQIAADKERTDLCQMAADPIDCLFESFKDAEKLEMVLAIDCEGAGETCVETATAVVSDARCTMSQ